MTSRSIISRMGLESLIKNIKSCKRCENILHNQLQKKNNYKLMFWQFAQRIGEQFQEEHSNKLLLIYSSLLIKIKKLQNYEKLFN